MLLQVLTTRAWKLPLLATALASTLVSQVGCPGLCAPLESEVFDAEAVEANRDAQPAGAILAIGDSFLEWNAEETRSIPDVVARRLDRPVKNRAVSGASFVQPNGCAAEEGFDVQAQYFSGGWDWVIVNGGGNDLNGQCDCGTCGELMDALISPDGITGDIPTFVRAVTDTGAKVMWVGYYDMPADASYGFDRCNDELEAIRPRLEAMAFSLPDVWYVSADEVIDPTEPNADDFIDDDRVHPSIAGSDRIGKLVADAILAAEQA